MRKVTASVFVLMALLAVCATAFTVLGTGGSTKAALTENFSGRTVKNPLHIHYFSHNSSGGGLTPAQFRKAYGVDQLSNNGAGVIVAIVDAYGNPHAQATGRSQHI